MIVSRPLFALMFAGTLGAGCLADPVDGSDDPGAIAPEELLPDGTHGVDRVRVGSQVAEVSWVAHEGLKFVDDDYAIGPALVHEPELFSGSKATLTPWTDGHVPYCTHGLDAADVGTIEQALIDLQAITPLQFDEMSCTAAAALPRFLDYTQNSTLTSSRSISGVGHPSGTTIEFTTNFNARTVWHETGHAVGYLHEQRRGDRAQYVNYYPACLDDPDNADQFALETTSINWSPYDVTSVMEYTSESFSSSNATPTTCPTLLYGYPSPATAPFYNGTSMRGTLITKSQQWSAEDINGAYQIYEPQLGNAEVNDRFGTRVAAGDFDGDGYDDLAVTAFGEAPYSAPSSGVVLIYKGTMNGLAAWRMLREVDFGATEQTADGFGSALLAGDIDGDGDEDLFIGAHLAGSARGGVVYPYLGGRGGLAPAPAGRLSQGNTAGAGASEYGDFFGEALAMGHFLDGTAMYLAVGAPYEEPSGAGARGVVQLFRWNGSSPMTYATALWASQATTPHDGDMFGAALASTNLNGGGDDLIVGAPQIGTGAGMVIPFYGHTTAMIAGTPLAHTNAASGDRFGAAVAAGQIGFAAHPVVVAGAPGRLTGTGRVYVYDTAPSGSAATFTQAPEVKESDIPGQNGQNGDAFGTAVVVDDLDGDNLDEILVGAPGKTVGGVASAGAVFEFSTYGIDQVLAPSSPSASDGYGGAIAVGNFNAGRNSVVHDSHPDLAIGIPGRAVSGQPGAGVVNVYRGSQLSLWRQLTEEITGGPQ